MPATSQSYLTNPRAESVVGVAMSKPCRYCESLQHTGFLCPNKPRSSLKTYKPMNKIGPVAKKTARAVTKWKKTVEPNHRGNYICYICGREVPYLMAEHVESKARHPDRRTDLTNLKPTCADCNREKGSYDN